jgi:hypothetical protein
VTVEATREILSCVPRRLAEWRVAEDGRVVAERPRPTTSGLRGAWDHLRWLMSHPRIRFDELGSHVWCEMDGAATVAEIAASTSAAFPDRSESMAERVALFATALHHQGLIELRVSLED